MTPKLCFLGMLFAFLFGAVTAYAEDVQCGTSIEYGSQKVDAYARGADGDMCLAEAISQGCGSACSKSGDVSPECRAECAHQARIHSSKCRYPNGRPCVVDVESARIYIFDEKPRRPKPKPDEAAVQPAAPVTSSGKSFYIGLNIKRNYNYVTKSNQGLLLKSKNTRRAPLLKSSNASKSGRLMGVNEIKKGELPADAKAKSKKNRDKRLMVPKHAKKGSAGLLR